MKKILLILFISFSSLILAQEKYLIYFTDKGGSAEISLSKKADLEKIAEKHLSKRSIERRKKTLGENFLKYEDLPIEAYYIEQIENLGIKIEHKLKWFNAVSAYLNDDQIKSLNEKEFIKKVEKIRKTKSIKSETEIIDSQLNKSSNSSSYTHEYGISLTQNELSDIPKVHDMGITGAGVLIGLLDTGFDWETHISLKDRSVIAEYDFHFNDGETANDSKDLSSSQHNHGTSVFSIIAGYDEGVLIGPAFDADYLLAKTEYLPTETHVEEDNYAAALEWMDSIGADITSSSLGYSEFDSPETSYTYEDMDGETTIVTKAAEMAFDRGIVVVTSAGNEGNSTWKYITAPGDGFNTLTIGAVTSDNVVTSFSSEGPTYDGRIKPELVAMGSTVVNARADTENGYSTGNGTSYAAPISAGIAGLLLSVYPHLTNKQVRSILIESGDNTSNPDNEVGYGLISALKAVTFPNLKANGNGYIVNKIFDPDLDIVDNTVELVIEGVSSSNMIKSGNIYQTELPELNSGQTYEFYFTYKDSQNSDQRIPADKNYYFEYGQLYLDLIVTDISELEQIPNDIYLSQNYPNPFNPWTKINFSIPSSYSGSKVILKVYDVLGNEVKTLVNENKSAGNYSVEFSASGLSSGVYFYQLRSGEFVQTRKLTILK